MTIDWTTYLSDEAKLRKDSVMAIPKGDDIISLALGLPSPDCFPLKGIKLDVESPNSNFLKTETIQRNIIEHPDEIISSCQYMSSNGIQEFNNWVKNYIEKYFKPNYNNWDFLIQSGATQSLDAIFRMLINPNKDTILCENLTYSCFLETCIPFRVNLFSVEMDEFGIIPENLDILLNNWLINEKTKNLNKPKIFYLVPTGHNPTGITLSTERRIEIVNIANKHDLIIIEDDPYYHLQLDNNSIHIPSLLNFDTQGRVIRIDSFSKMLMPGLRVSIVTCNKLFIKNLSMHNELSIHSASANSQLILQMIFNQWGNDGFESWLKHLQSLYLKRRNILLNAFDKFLPKDLVNYNRPNYGMFIWINANMDKFKKLENSKLNDFQWAEFIENEIYKVASEKYKVILTKGHWFMKDKNSLIAGFRATYSFVDEDKMIKGAELFGKAVEDVYKSLYN
jgi:aromatic amino acid aminotransferase I